MSPTDRKVCRLSVGECNIECILCTIMSELSLDVLIGIAHFTWLRMHVLSEFRRLNSKHRPN